MIKKIFAILGMMIAIMQPALAVVNYPFFNGLGKIDATNWYISNGWVDGSQDACEWESGALSDDSGNLKITLSNSGGSLRKYGCGELQSMNKYGYGLYQVRMKTAKGSGLNSNFFTYTGSPQHDEIDFEFLGKNSNTVQLNYFVAGAGGHEYIVNLGFDSSADFHTYAFAWTPNDITWFVDGALVHKTVALAKLPKNASRMYLSLWAGSSAENGWLGVFNYTAPVSAEYQWVKFTPMLPNGLIPQ